MYYISNMSALSKQLLKEGNSRQLLQQFYARKQERVKVEHITTSTRNCQTSKFAQRRHRKENIKIIRFPQFAT